MLTIAQRRNRIALGVGFVMGLATLFVVAYAVSRSANDFVRTADDVARVNRVIGRLQQLDLSLTRAESAERGFLLTNDPSFLSSRTGFRDEVERNLYELRSLESQHPEALALLDELEELVDQRIDVMQRVTNLRDTIGRDAAVAVVARREGLTLMKRIRDARARLEQIERATLRSDDLSNRRNRDEARLYLFTGLGFAMVAVTVSMTIVLRDSFRRMQAESRLATLLSLQNAIFESAAAAIISCDSQGRITSFNRTAERLLGYRAEDVLRVKSIVDIHDQEELRAFRDEVQCVGEDFLVLTLPARKNEQYERRWTLLRQNGTRLPAMVSYSVMRDETGHEAGFVAVATDLTEIESARRELQLHIEQLEDTQRTLARQNDALERATGELKESRDVALAATRLKSEFLANMSHEIRTPMNGVLGMAHLLLQSNLNDRQRSFVTTMQHSAESLLTILNDILDLSKMEAGKMNLEHFPFDLRDVLEDLVESLAPIGHRKGLEVVLDFPPSVPHLVIGDALRLRQIITNLFSNAIKFTDQGEVSVVVRYSPDGPAEGKYRISVRDTGIGIPDQQLLHIFESFAQADGSTTRKFGGSGLGLSIVRQLCHLMGGEVTVSSRMGRGSVFSVLMPFSLQPAAAEGTPARVQASRIWVVDDHETNRTVARELLESWGATVEVFASGDTVINRLHEVLPPNLIVMDMHMPGQDGVQTATTIREEHPHLPLVLLSSLGYLAYAEKNPHLFRAVLSKPVRSRQLFDTVNMVLLGYSEAPHSSDNFLLQELPGIRVLVVEDNPVNQLVAMEMLTAMRCEADVVEDGLAAVAKLEAGERYDAIFMDIQMPKMDGLEATREIRRIEMIRGEHTPIVAMTANAMTGDRERCLEAGMDSYLAKPLQARELLDRLLEFVHIVAPIETPMLDLERLNTAVANKPTLKIKVITKYLEGSERTINEIRSRAADGDVDGLQAAAHNLKGSSLTLGSQTIADHCALIEQSARNRIVETERIENLTTDLHILWGELRTILDETEVNP